MLTKKKILAFYQLFFSNFSASNKKNQLKISFGLDCFTHHSSYFWPKICIITKNCAKGQRNFNFLWHNFLEKNQVLRTIFTFSFHTTKKPCKRSGIYEGHLDRNRTTEITQGLYYCAKAIDKPTKIAHIFRLRLFFCTLRPTWVQAHLADSEWIQSIDYILTG